MLNNTSLSDVLEDFQKIATEEKDLDIQFKKTVIMLGIRSYCAGNNSEINLFQVADFLIDQGVERAHRYKESLLMVFFKKLLKSAFGPEKNGFP